MKTIREFLIEHTGMTPEEFDKSQDDFWKNLRRSTGLDDAQLKRFDEASSHLYECRCELCIEWWKLVPPEDEPC